MDHNQVQEYLMLKPETNLYYPFGDEVKVFRVKNKIFATLAFGKGSEKGTEGKMAGQFCINLKCDPDEALILRDIFPSVISGYHMNKILSDIIPICFFKRKFVIYVP